MFPRKDKKTSAREDSENVLNTARRMAVSDATNACKGEWLPLIDDREIVDCDFIVEMLNFDDEKNPYEVYYIRSILRDPVQSDVDLARHSSNAFYNFPLATLPQAKSTPTRDLTKNVIVGLLVSVILIFYMFFIKNI